MSAFRSRRLESIFGTQVDSLTPDIIRSLVDNGVEESYDLDFKANLYGTSDAEKRELSADVASFANMAGGVLLLGVAEDKQGRAKAAGGVSVSDAERVRMLQVIASGVSPMPNVEIFTVPMSSGADDEAEPEDGGLGFFLIAVPRSLLAPHLVLVNKDFRVPKRHGQSKRFLSESELAAAYRERFVGLAGQVERLGRVESELVAHLDLEEKPWLVVSLVPDLPGEFELTHAAQKEFETAVLGSEVRLAERFTTFQKAYTGRRRLHADASNAGKGGSRRAAAEFHCDGSGAYALWVADLLSHGLTEAGTAREQMADDEGLVLAVMSGLHFLARSARDRAGAGGNALVRATLIPSHMCRIGIGFSRQFGAETRSSVLLSEEASYETVADIDDLAEIGPSLMAATARLSDGVAQSFGIAELGQVSREGDFRIIYWGRSDQPRLRTWAENYAIPVSAESLG